jgi:hypothetical protein
MIPSLEVPRFQGWFSGRGSTVAPKLGIALFRENVSREFKTKYQCICVHSMNRVAEHSNKLTNLHNPPSRPRGSL